jgi:hypothetical protein
MRDKIFNYGIAIGLIVSMLGFIFLKCDLLSGNYSQLIYNLYKITASIAILFILTKSTFVKENFNLILKAVGFVFLVMLIINLLKEFDVYEIDAIRTISYLVLGSLLVMYTHHFLKKKKKEQLDYLKIGFVTLLFVGGFLNLFDLRPSALKYMSAGFFWVVVIGMLYINHEKETGIKKYVG